MSWKNQRMTSERTASVLRRVMLLIGVALVLTGVIMVLSIGVSHTSTGELIAGRNDTQSLLLPLGLFAAGIVCLAWGLP
ncbi:MAG: hypothetical protein JWO59_1989 [Chloroflexi bacterium]|nr:hypothetical protein [Chloroflexota bacterium]